MMNTNKFFYERVFVTVFSRVGQDVIRVCMHSCMQK